MRKLGVLALAITSACSGGADTATTLDTADVSRAISTSTTEASPDSTSETVFPPPPAFPEGPLDPITEQGLSRLLTGVFTTEFDSGHLVKVVEGGDVRAAWLIADLLRFYQGGPNRDDLVWAYTQLTKTEYVPNRIDYVWASNNLIAWDMPVWDGYKDMKQQLYGPFEPVWNTFFDNDSGVDWRLITWGGVLADDRPLGDNGRCNCIPALDNPATTDAHAGSWYPDDRIVFGVVVKGEALALPKHQMEVHEMVNTTLGGVELGIPYCTLCGSAQAYVTDNIPGSKRVVLRTSGLLSRSNKVMYDLTTGSMFDTFTGQALTGPLGEAGVVLEQVSVVGATWGDWKAAHPDTTILAEDGGIGREYPDDPLRGRDAAGPIFPVGDVDPRLPVMDLVIGVVSPDGTQIAFPVDAVTVELTRSGEVEFDGVVIRLEDVLRVFDKDGGEIISHQAFWFAWSQFHPETSLWSATGS